MARLEMLRRKWTRAHSKMIGGDVRDERAAMSTAAYTVLVTSSESI